MSFELSKVVRVRPSNPTLDERLSPISTSSKSIYKGLMSDIRLEVYESDTDYKLSFIQISDSSVINYTVKKSDISIDKVIDNQIKSYSRERINYRGLKNVDPDTYYTIIQNPWLDEPPVKRSYGYDPYFLNNGVRVDIKWFQNDGITQTGGVNWSSDNGSELKTSGSFSSDVLIKKVECISDSEIFTVSGNDFIKYDKNTKNGDNFPGSVLDIKLLDKIIEIWKKKIPNYDLKICEPSHYPTTTLEYKSPLLPVAPVDNTTPISGSQSDRFKLTIEYDKNFIIKAGQDIPTITIYFGDKPSSPSVDDIFTDDFNDLYLLDDEYTERQFNSEDESPSDIPEASTSYVESQATTNSYNSSLVEIDLGKYPSVPVGSKAYSHTKEQGYNLINSQWYGNLLVSAKLHIDHPTFDIEGTDKGSLGCASWVSMVFYRAFGVHMKTGLPVKKVPKSISDFGSKGTSELGSWFSSNPNMWNRIPWQQGQPGDIINTERNFSTNEAGHVGIILDEKHKDGSWVVASNSSKGFGSKGDPLGCGKKNYSVKSWESVAKRNPSRTFCYRYKGPKLSPGETA